MHEMKFYSCKVITIVFENGNIEEIIIIILSYTKSRIMQIYRQNVIIKFRYKFVISCKVQYAAERQTIYKVKIINLSL